MRNSFPTPLSLSEIGPALVGALTRRLPERRWQVSHWLGKLMVPSHPFIGRFHGGRIEVRPGEIASMASFFLGFYEREVTMWCRELIRMSPPALLLDVGANFGYYPLLFELLGGSRTQSIAFEPDPANLAWLETNIGLNPGARITPVAKAVGSRDGVNVDFQVSREGYNLWAKVGSGASTTSVPATTLDTFMAESGLDSASLTLMDVEGYEGEVIAGMREGIAAQRYHNVIVEFHPAAFPEPARAIAEMSDLFLTSGYRGYRFRPHHPGSADKDRAYYRMAYDPTILMPLEFDGLTSWEHFLFTCRPAAELPRAACDRASVPQS